MVRIAVFALAASVLASFAGARPLPYSTTGLVKRAFALQDYADFQISDGQTGNAQAEAAAVFLDPFNGVDLATIDSTTQDDIETMRQAAESAETDQFNPAIDAAGSKTANGIALQNGKIKNKVLKLTAEVQGLNIKLAQAKAAGDDTSDIQSKLDEETTKLNTNIATDVKNADEASKGVA